MPDFVISKLLVPVTGISPAYDKSDAVAPGSVYELFVNTTVLFLPISVMVGAVLSIIRLGPVRFAFVNVKTFRESSLNTKMENARLFVSETDESIIYFSTRVLPVGVDTTVFDAIVPVAEPIVPFATKVMVISSPR